MQKNILTIATGKKLYIDLAINLARSFIWWHKNTNIKFHIVTDHPECIPDDIRDKVLTITVNQGELGEGFSSKLYLDKLSPSGQTLFIDSDCLIFENLEDVFNRFKGHNVSVIGGFIRQGEWFGDVAAVCRQFNIPHLPKFNGGIYYVEKGEKANAVYETARGLERRYDEIGFTRLRNKPNDEVIMALAMQLHGEVPIPEDGTIMSDPQACPGGYDLEVLTGERWLRNPPPPDPKHQTWYPFHIVKPAVMHFLGFYTQHYPYKREVYKLEAALQGKGKLIPLICSKLMIEYPARIKSLVKDSLRPLFHQLFGVRKVKKSERD